jgi:KDO2-lipid IV(A) lauroyltransferase
MYYIVFGLLYTISLLPLWILYRLSDLAFVIIYYILRYRRDVVDDNLLHAFPEKSDAERKRIARKFYRCFCDNWIETIKLFSISKKALLKRISGDFSVYSEVYATGRSLQGNYGHFFNWEIQGRAVTLKQPYIHLAAYFPQKSVIADRLTKYSRTKWGSPMIASTEMARAIIPWRKKQYAIALIADQSLQTPESGYWLNFMGRPACFVKGPEKFARGQNMVVTMTTTTRKKRGYYNFDTFLVTKDVTSLPDGELMRLYVKHLEENIRLQPELYLWSHRRWKHAWKPEYEKLWVGSDPAPKN